MKRFIVLLMAFLLLFSATACGEIKSQGTGKANEIKVHLYKGGFDDFWLRDIAKRFNETVLKDTDYEITVYGNLNMPETLIPGLANEKAPYNLYVSETCEWGSAIMKDYLVDLSDLIEEEVDGKPLREKIKGFDEWKDVFTKKDGSGLYALPWSTAILGMVYEHEEFLDMGWYSLATEEADGDALKDQNIEYEEITNPSTLQTYLSFVSYSGDGSVNYEFGDKILTAGKDGKYGTYDDGQPETLEEFDNLISQIKKDRVTPFIWTGQSDSYMDTVFNALFAQIGGKDVYDTFYNYHSNGKQVELVDGTVKAISIEEGYLVKQLKALKDTYDFFEKHFDYSNPSLARNMHSACEESSASHYDAQNRFLLGYNNDSSNPNTAILFDGIWWQNEAKTMFEQLEPVGRGANDREYRYLLLPEIPGQKTPADKTVFSTTTSGSIVIPKGQSETSLNYVKQFVKFLLSEENLRYIARSSGNILSYNYTLTEEDLASMTPFQRNVAELYADTEHIEVKKEQLDMMIRSPLTFASSKGYKNLLYPLIQGTFPQSVIKAIKDYDLETIVKGLADSYTKTAWDTYVREARDNGYLLDL